MAAIEQAALGWTGAGTSLPARSTGCRSIWETTYTTTVARFREHCR